ncbi:hypothetical protein [Nocardia sp. CA-120079]|uniref:hypothetical protein n=1 Tax=Nocardia sp. CA-120079 TaxID=3239974 RepID=UPI003D971D88
MAAAWELVGCSVEIMHIRRDGDLTPAYRIFSNGTRTLLPHRTRGTVYFDEWNRPDLVVVRGWFPSWAKLFDVVARDCWKYLDELGLTPYDGEPVGDDGQLAAQRR